MKFMRFMSCFCALFIVQVFCCKTGDIGCKKKQLLVVFELFKHYRELKTYQQLLTESRNDSLSSDDGNSLSVNVDHTTVSSVPDVHPPNPTNSAKVMDMVSHRLNFNHNEKIETTTPHNVRQSHVTKTADELDSVVTKIRNFLLMIILSPEKIETHDLNLVFKALVKPGNEAGRAVHYNDKPVTTAHTILTTQSTTHPKAKMSYVTTPSYSNMHSKQLPTTPGILFSTPQEIPFSTTEYVPFPLLGPIKIPMSKTLTTAPKIVTVHPKAKKTTLTTATKIVTVHPKAKNKPAKKTKHQIRKKKFKNAKRREAIKEYNDSVFELREKLAEYQTMQRLLLFGYGRK